MRRFLVFPSLLAMWFLAGQFGTFMLREMSFWLTMHSVGFDTSFPPVPQWPQAQFFQAAFMGAVVGGAFALLDFLLHQNKRTVQDTALQLTNSLLKSGVVAVGLIILCHAVCFYFNRHRRYQISPRQMTLVQVLTLAPKPLLLVALLWSSVKTLR